MNVTTFENGRVVLSKQGRDKGRLFIVLTQVNENFVLVVDGDLRKLEKPKLKRLKHLHATPHVATQFLNKIQNKQNVFDSDIINELNQFRKVCEYGKR